MAMRPVGDWPVSTQGMRSRVLDVVVKADQDGTQKTGGPEKLLAWTVSLMVERPGQDAAELLDLTVYQQTKPAFAQFSDVRIIGDQLIAHHWGSGKNSGFWYECQGIESVDSKGSHSKGGEAA